MAERGEEPHNLGAKTAQLEAQVKDLEEKIQERDDTISQNKVALRGQATSRKHLESQLKDEITERVAEEENLTCQLNEVERKLTAKVEDESRTNATRAEAMEELIEMHSLGDRNAELETQMDALQRHSDSDSTRSAEKAVRIRTFLTNMAGCKAPNTGFEGFLAAISQDDYKFCSIPAPETPWRVLQSWIGSDNTADQSAAIHTPTMSTEMAIFQLQGAAVLGSLHSQRCESILESLIENLSQPGRVSIPVLILAELANKVVSSLGDMATRGFEFGLAF